MTERIPIDDTIPLAALPDEDAAWRDDDELAQLRKELRQKVDKGTTRIAIPAREGYEVEYSLQVNAQRYSQWEDRARRRRGGTSGELDVYRLAVQVLQNLCVNIWRRGKPLDMTFRNEELHDLLGVDATSTHRGRDALIALYGGEEATLDIIWAYGKWAEAAGRDWDEFGGPVPDPM
jgi:hypothetical protein